MKKLLFFIMQLCIAAALSVPALAAGSYSSVDGETIAIVAVVSLVAAGIVCLILWMQMRSVKKATRADNYLTPGGVRIHRRYDRFSHTTVTRVRVKSDKPK